MPGQKKNQGIPPNQGAQNAQNPLQGLFDPNAMQTAMNQMMKTLQEAEKNPNKGLDFGSIVTDAVSTMTGSQMDPEMKKMVSNMASVGLSGMGDQGAVAPPVENSRIQLDQSSASAKGIKQPKQEQTYEELDDDEEVDIFRPRTKDIEINLNVSLEEFYNGREKKIAIPRKRIKKDGKKQVVVAETKKIVIPIEPGMRDEQVIRYNKQASELPGYETGDIVVTLRENGHNYFEREGDNLFIVKNISLFESYAASVGMINLVVRNLNSVYLRLDTKGGPPLHTLDGLRKVIGQGMPLYRKEGFGDLYIKFNLLLPEKMEVEQIQAIKTICPPVEREYIVYNDGSKGGMTFSDSQDVIDCKLEMVTEEDLEKLDYEEYSDESEYDSDDYSEEDDDESDESEEDETDRRRARRYEKRH